MARKFRPGRYEFMKGKRNYSAGLEAQLDQIVINTEARLNMVVRQSLQEVTDMAQKPVGKGGLMRLDTGFLRASGQSALNGMPTGPVRGESDKKGFYDDGSKPVKLQLGEFKLGATFYFGWTANYAKYREAFDGFLEAAVQAWPNIVKGVVERAKKKVK